MITDKNTWELEKDYLRRVINEISIQLNNGVNAASNYKKEAIEMQKNMWEDVRCAPTNSFDLEAPAQMWQYQMDLNNQARKYKLSTDKVSRLEKMYESPYFGRVDFIENGEEEAEKIYIGIYTLSTNNNMDILVYDWRAPISSMFYDYEIGECSYDCPAGSIGGKLLLKRQYKIENMNIVYMFDSSLSINDEMLKDILGKSTDNRMKTIVTSIQREQNAVIRNSQNKILIVEGPAGSGKTSIALHRAAYLLYKYRENMKSDNILVFSPNHVFEDYISNVLPELGEENIRRSTFIDFFENMFDSRYRIETMNQQMEYILARNLDKRRLRSIKFKASSQFLNILKRYMQHIEDGMSTKFKNLICKGTLIISADEILRTFKEDYFHFSFAKRLEKLRQRLFYLLEQHEEKRIKELLDNYIKENNLQEEALPEEEKKLAERKAREEIEPLKVDIMQMTYFDIYLLYIDLFRNIENFAKPVDEKESDGFISIANYTIRQLQRNIINYEDVAPIILLKTVLDTVSDTKSVKHVIIDEAQDYTVIHYEIIKKAFEHSNMTILGDLNQSVNGYMNIGSFGAISETFNAQDANSISLTKSYRSSKEIADFCREILNTQNNLEQLNRHGDKPRIIKVDKSNSSRRIAEDIINLKEKGFKLIAVICKTAGQCEELYKSVNSYVDITLISNQNEIYRGGVVVIPSYLAKGLEFDAVLVNSIEDSDYSKEEDRRLLYTVCTRALHELYLYYIENISDLIKNVNERYYTHDILI
ncbi:RNA polymerase recycling motor HelD [Pseudobacteroides cellulosolvens]|uniref:Helicase superfamily 1 UvrD-related protein n=1 Tax=Pseudobacteroides cellulosolvens ATCC 35603 = DSM 2933 TaxID=398512 RepID=A0A0L6JJK8_9FIRM|nr:RNA polymerase recycling motor HelD [Pseudobacteroides cellulosolvens]KNY26066.1 Helicase superfamily 1 UvrD-related protein [Pseudobacteroides cellulosolvens ATCC 35603 = DSM 2933]